MGWIDRLDINGARLLGWLSDKPLRAVAALILFCLALYLPGQASLPVTDRDEARFAQATKQMLETGDFIDIRFQDAPRYKKPIGIYWLQSASVAVFGNEARNNIWAYRVPSLLAMIATALLTWWAARPIFGRQTALLAAVLLASSITVAMEARIAKSDAALLAFIVLAEGALARIYLLRLKPSQMVGIAATFWVALGLGILIKGPVAPVVIGLTVAALVFGRRDRAWLRNFHAAWGIPMLLTVVLPWFIAIAVISEGSFFQGSVGKDFLQKLIGGEEKHGGPPGFYLVAFWWSFWPGALIVTTAAALWLWRNRVSRRALLLLALIAPFWLVIEIVPTKLPHYALPLYPAIAMAAAWVLREQALPGRIPLLTYKLGALLWFSVAMLQLAALGFGLRLFEARFHAAYAVAAFLFVGLVLAGAVAAWRAKYYAALMLGIAAAFILYLTAFTTVLPGMRPLWPALRALEAVAPFKPCDNGPVGFEGYNEPSSVFLLGTDTHISRDAASALAEGRLAYVFVNERKQAAFEAALQKKGIALPAPLACAKGVDINGGGLMNFRLYSLKPAETFAACKPKRRYRCQDAPPARWERLFGG